MSGLGTHKIPLPRQYRAAHSTKKTPAIRLWRMRKNSLINLKLRGIDGLFAIHAYGEADWIFNRVLPPDGILPC